MEIKSTRGTLGAGMWIRIRLDLDPEEKISNKTEKMLGNW